YPGADRDRQRPESHRPVRRRRSRSQAVAGRVRRSGTGNGERMSIRREDVLHVARLAELDVAEADLPKLVDQMGGIVAFVERFIELPAGGRGPPFLAGPDRTPLREDVVDPVKLVRPPSSIAPDFSQGLFLVPRLGAMEGE